jgi:membrane associated rhomboid family serine protease
MAQAQLPDKGVGFQPHQLFTHAFLHGGIPHLAGNLLFMLVFGLRVNELLGNTKTLLVYPLLAALAAGVELWANRDHPLAPSLGASGAIAGLAGMYLVFFPVQRIRMIAYMNLWVFTAFQCLSILFWIRGFWLLPLMFIWNDLVPVLVKDQDNIGHFAHLGGFGSGILLAVALLLARQAKARGDILSVVLGKRAWPLVGKPTRLSQSPPAALGAAPVPVLPIAGGAS